MDNSKSLKIGVDLDHTVYGFPSFFAAFIPTMSSAGHKFYCTSNHLKDKWPQDRERLRGLGIDPDLIDPSLMQEGPKDEGAENKARMANECDFVFDDAAKAFQHLTATPVFNCPFHKALENQCVI